MGKMLSSPWGAKIKVSHKPDSSKRQYHKSGGCSDSSKTAEKVKSDISKVSNPFEAAVYGSLSMDMVYKYYTYYTFHHSYHGIY